VPESVREVARTFSVHPATLYRILTPPLERFIVTCFMGWCYAAMEGYPNATQPKTSIEVHNAARCHAEFSSYSALQGDFVLIFSSPSKADFQDHHFRQP